MPNGPDMKYIL